ncbi:hypothetical protein IJ707_07750, partial [bacterium]|nr:hypothetical protein [bacterium]
MLKELLELKNSGVIGIKLEYESEFYDEKSAYELAELVHRVGLDLCVKLGGFSSIQDLHMCRKMCANSIVAPMIESSYAVEKFLNCVNQVYGKAYPELLLNIETKTAFDNLDEIIDKCNKRVSGFVLGRSDLKRSLSVVNPDDKLILDYCISLSALAQKNEKKFIIGGKINSKSVDFISKIPYLSSIETRKVIFNKDVLTEENLEKFLQFELQTLKFKK